MKNILLAAILGVVSMTSVHAEDDKIPFAGEAIILDRPAWLFSVNKLNYSKKYSGRRYPANYHESKDGKLIFCSELDRDSEGKDIEAIHKASVSFQEESFSDVLTWNKKGIIPISGKKFSLLDLNIKDPEGDKDFTFRMIVLDTVVNGKVSHTIIVIHDEAAEKAYVEKLYKWIQQEKS